MISIIIPVYNTKNYLEQCIDSVLEQTYKNIEIILVDDGSTDGSSDICDKYSNDNSNIIVIHKKNEGLQAALIDGIKASAGEYIGFVDGDDWIDPEMFQFLHSEMADVDMIATGIARHFSNGDVVEWLDNYDEGIYDTNTDEFINNLIISKKYCGTPVIGGLTNHRVTKLFKRDLVLLRESLKKLVFRQLKKIITITLS